MEIAFWILVGAVTALAVLGIVAVVTVALVSGPFMTAAMRLSASWDVPGAAGAADLSVSASSDLGQDKITDRNIPAAALDASKTAQNRLGTELPFTEGWAKSDARDGSQTPLFQPNPYFSVPGTETSKPCRTCAKIRAALKRAFPSPRRGSLQAPAQGRRERKTRKSGGEGGDQG